MNFKKTVALALAALFALPVASLRTARADEGMWPFNNIPRADIKKKYGFDVTDEWLKKVQLSSVRFNSGGSGSFVSPDGLVMTNHHIAGDVLQKISTEKKDYFKDGFYAKTRAEEAKAPDLELNVLISIEDVTARVKGAVKPDMSPGAAQKARAAESAAISDESTKATGLRSDVVTLYQGGQYNLYRYKKYTDVRLVFAPEFEIAFFGGDPDNFEFPRYDLDLALFRVYENGQPIHTDNYFKWSKNGSKDGDLVFVSGHPGSTSRLNTYAHLTYLRDTGFPFLLKYLEHQRALFQKYSAISEENDRRAKEDLFGIENSLKARKGGLEGLQDAKIMARKKQEEDALRAKVMADPAKAKAYGDAWDNIAKGRQGQAAYEKERRFYESAWGFNSEYFGIARTLVRLAAENAKPNGERLPEFTDGNRESLELDLFSPAPIYTDFENLKLADSFAFMRDEMGASNPIVQKALAGKTPEARAKEMIEATKLGDVEVRKQIAAGGQDAIDKSDDPFIQLAKAVDGEARAVRKRYETEVISNERANYAKISGAIFDIEGTKNYPDATFTLRLSYGAVKGYNQNGKWVAPYTEMSGLYKHSAEHGNKYPYRLPDSWVEKKSALDLKTPFNFVTTDDIIGGNSGSPMINTKGEIVGLIFDGNIQSLLGDFIYDESVNRSVGVDSRGMIEALRKIYGANEVADELTK
jgi:hypothetical protein